MIQEIIPSILCVLGVLGTLECVGFIIFVIGYIRNRSIPHMPELRRIQLRYEIEGTGINLLTISALIILLYNVWI